MTIQTIIYLIIKFLEVFTPHFNKDDSDAHGIDDNTTPIDTIDTNVLPPLPLPETEPIQPTHQQKLLWCLDNGHGRLTNGKRSPVLPDGRIFFEYEFNRIIVNKVAAELSRLGVAYYIVVPEIEVGNILTERVKRANEYETPLDKIYLSIHANAAPSKWTQAEGVETWYKYTANPYYAFLFQQTIIEATGAKDRGVKSRRDKEFYVLRKAQMPSVLLELGFFNNLEEVQRLLNNQYQDKLVKGIVDAIMAIELNHTKPLT